MSCRHAFHQTCVDEWLQTGRNNCPACRTTVRPRKYLFYNAYLAHDCFLSHLGRDGWHKQLHILISYIKNQSFFVILFSEPKKNVSYQHIGHAFPNSLFFNSFVISDPCSGSTFLLVIFCNRFSSRLASYTVSSNLSTYPTTQHNIPLISFQFVLFFPRFGPTVFSKSNHVVRSQSLVQQQYYVISILIIGFLPEALRGKKA